MLNDADEIIEWFGTASDVTAHKEAVEALQEERAIQESFYNSMPFMMGVAEIDGDKTIALSANQKLTHFLEMPMDDFRGLTGAELGDPQEIERLWVSQFRRCQRENRVIRFEYQEPRLPATSWLNSTVSFIGIGPTGRPRFSFAVEDFTERKHIQEALRKSEELFRTLSNTAPALIWYNDAEGRNLFINRFFVTFTGKTEEQIQGTGWHDLIHADDAEDYIADYLRAVRDQRSWYNRNRIRRHDGEWRWFDNYAQPLFGSDGTYLGHVGISTDITATISAEQQVKAERQRLYDLFMAVPAAIAVMRGPEHIVELVNPFGMQIIGIHRDPVGKPTREALPEIVAQGLVAVLDRIYQTGIPYKGNEVSVQFNRNNNGILEHGYYNFVYQPSYNTAGEVDGVISYANDVTDSVQARKRTEESEERLRALANSVPQLVWSANAEGAIDFFNDRLNEYAEMPRKENGIYDWQVIIHPEDRERTQQHWDGKGGSFELEHRLQMKDGTYRWHLVRGIPISNGEGTLLCWYGTSTDIEHLKQLERQRINFLGVVSHELKTPVTSAKAFAEVLENRFRKAGDDTSATLLGKMHTQMEKLTLLISDLLDVTRLEAGKVQFHEDFFVFDALVDDILEEVQRTTTHTLQREGTTNATVYGDRERIGQVLTNLLTNAVKYSPNRSQVVVRTSRQVQDVLLCVQDFGIGIARDKLPHVFERFYRETGTREDTFAGLGLGLYVASEILSRQGGRIWVESEKGQGSTFCFILPLQMSKETIFSEPVSMEE